MNMGMIQQRLCPGMQQSYKADLRTKVFGICWKFLQCLGYRHEKDVVSHLLVPYGDFLNRNYRLEPPGYVEQYWEQHYKAKSKESLRDIYNVSLENAIKLSKDLGIPLHPKYIFYWSQINKEQFKSLIYWLIVSKIEGGKIIFPYTKKETRKYSKVYYSDIHTSKKLQNNLQLLNKLQISI